MGRMIQIDLKGFEKTIKKINALEPKLRKEVAEGAYKKGAEIILAEVKSRAHVRSGKNAKYLKVKRIKGRAPTGYAVQTGSRSQLGIPASDQGYYPMSEEFGTQKHAAHPYMRPGLKAKESQAKRAIGKEMIKGLKRIVGRA